MYSASLENTIDQFTAKKFATAFDFLKRPDLRTMAAGWYELDNGVRASVQHYTTFGWDENNFETHEKYYDVQYLADGTEYVGVVSRNGLTEKTPYEASNDITFYNEPERCGKILLNSGDYVVLGPADAHKPRCAVETGIPVIKVVVKVPVDGE